MKRGALRRKEGDGNGRTEEEEERKANEKKVGQVEGDIREKVEEEYDEATWRRISS